MKTNVIEKIVKNNLCVGCGVCAGICPANVLSMQFNQYGEYNPDESSDCIESCNLCLQVCPFYDNDENEDTLASGDFGNFEEIEHRTETGYYLHSYAGYSNVNDHRVNGASGGMATWILENLLTKNIVDHVVCVTPIHDSEKLFNFAIFSDTESVRRSAKSAYYPVEISEIIKQIKKSSDSYAIVGIPCFLKGIKLAVEKNKKLKERIIFKIGLVCGQMKSKYYTVYLASLSGVDGTLKKVNYRGKSSQYPANNFFFHCTNYQNRKGKLFWNEGVRNAWANRWFTPNACNFCDDVFAELADVTLMDAWLAEYSQDFRGTNLLISRTPLISKLLEEGKKKGQIMLEDVSIQKIIQSQLGVINIKKVQIARRLFQAKKRGVMIPTKRIAPSEKINFLIKKEIELKDKMQVLSRESFLKFYRSQRFDLNAFSQKMESLNKELNTWYRIGSSIRILKRVLKKLKKNIPGA